MSRLFLSRRNVEDGNGRAGLVGGAPSLPLLLPMLSYVLAGLDFLAVGIYLDRGGSMDTALLAFGAGVTLWLGVGLFGMQLFGLRSKHALPTPPLCASVSLGGGGGGCSTRWVQWFAGVLGAWLGWVLLFGLCFYFEQPRAIFLTLGLIFLFVSLLIPLYHLRVISMAIGTLDFWLRFTYISEIG
jgi:hypothetical protein